MHEATDGHGGGAGPRTGPAPTTPAYPGTFGDGEGTPGPTSATTPAASPAPTPRDGPFQAPGPGPGPTLEALGLDVVPRDDPLTYPGARPDDSALLAGDRLLPLTRLVHEDRVPVLAVGSNASPAQLRAKLAECAITTPLPLVKARVTGLDIGVSAHVSRMGYISASPFAAPGTVRELFLTWLDAGQLAAVDASEGVPLPDGNYRRGWLPAPDVRIDLADGRTLPGAYAYVNRRGVLHDGHGTRLRHGDQRALLTGLLAAHPWLRELCGTTPEEFCARVRADPSVGARGTELFAEQGLVMASGLERFVRRGRATGSPGTGEPWASL